MNRMLDIAYQEMGVHEVAGPQANPRIMEYFRACGGDWVKDDATPWCGGFAGWCAVQCGHDLPAEPLRAKSWAEWGQPCEPQRGCVVVLNRGKDPSAGHVGMLDRIDEAAGRVYLTGGNQGDAVSTASFPISDVVAYRWPAGESRGAAAQEAVESVSIYQIINRVKSFAKWLGIGGSAVGTGNAAAKKAGVKVDAFDGVLSFAGDHWVLILIAGCLLIYCATEIIKDQIKTDVRSGAILPPAPGVPAPVGG
jgi:uncharacterized protein (TIGR02594 family)